METTGASRGDGDNPRRKLLRATVSRSWQQRQQSAPDLTKRIGKTQPFRRKL
jgi:hypothetical protein